MQFKKFRNIAFLRYLAGGAANTALSYCVYWLVLQFADYKIAFSVSYVAGIVTGYFINALLVLKVPITWRGLLGYPLAYVIPYLAGLVMIRMLVGGLGLDARLAPFVVMLVTTPLAFIMTRWVITPRRAASPAGD